MIKVFGKWGLLDELQKRSGPVINGGSFYQSERSFNSSRSVLHCHLHTVVNGGKYLGHYTYSDRLMQDCGGGYWLFVSVSCTRRSVEHVD